MPHIFIATPEQGTVHTAYMRSVINTMLELTRNKVDCTWWPTTGRHVWHQRNALAARFLKSDATHMAYVDSDMDFEGSLLRRLLSYARPMIGVPCRLRGVNGKWNVQPIPGASIQNGTMPCERIGFGIVLIQRAVIERMHENATSIYTVEGQEYRDLFGSFEEDVAFCRRWRSLGGEIFALLDARVGHIGDYAYGADQSYLDFLKAQGAFTPENA